MEINRIYKINEMDKLEYNYDYEKEEKCKDKES